MRIVLIIFSLPFVARLLLYIRHIVLVKEYINHSSVGEESWQNKSMLILIPVLREQEVIRETMNHFIKMQVKNCKVYLVISGTKREEKSNKVTTLEIVEKWIEERSNLFPENLDISYCEAEDMGGDRATQLNYAVEYIAKKKKVRNLDYIGVYDADSLPSLETLNEVLYSFSTDPCLYACQQPVHFINAANNMALNKENPILIANALYQSTWTVISEFPMWIKYYQKRENKLSKRHLYLIGHGEFLTKEAYDEFQFPEYEITDGIQLGYRMGMSNKKVKPLCEFCNDDVPHKLSALIKQHKRWFGGCMNLLSAYHWSKSNFNTNAMVQVIDGLFSQGRWAWTVISYTSLLIISVLIDMKIAYFYLLLGIVYCYAVPIMAHRILDSKIKVRFRDWACLPIAIFVKSIGPNWYIIEKILHVNIKYEKVER